MNPAINAMLDRYNCETRNDYENALKEIIQELALLGLWRAKFFHHAAFYGGTSLRILYGLDRFSEDIDFSLLESNKYFDLTPYLEAIKSELNSMGFEIEIAPRTKNIESTIESAFLKADTKEHLLKIAVPHQISERIARNDRIKIKLEIDTDPAGGFETEAKTLLQPIAFSVNSYKLPDLFGGKIHAILERQWLSGRVKGRDYYDFVWYIGRNTEVRLNYLEQKLRQNGSWSLTRAMTRTDLVSRLEQKFSKLDVELAKKDVLPFVKDRMAVEVWSNDFFLSLLQRLKTI